MINVPARLKLTIVTAVLLLLTAGGLLAPAQADKAGNSANAKQCQKGGYQTLYTSTGATFATEKECTSYAAQGGTLTTTPPYKYQAQRDQCESFGGIFTEETYFGMASYRCTSNVPFTEEQLFPASQSCSSTEADGFGGFGVFEDSYLCII